MGKQRQQLVCPYPWCGKPFAVGDNAACPDRCPKCGAPFTGAAQPTRRKPRSKRPAGAGGPNPVFLALLREEGLPEPVCEYRFANGRKWAFDYAWPDHGVALEVEGGVGIGGRHTSIGGFLRDMAKYNEAARLGWRLVRTVPAKLAKPATVRLIRDMLTREAQSDALPRAA